MDKFTIAFGAIAAALIAGFFTFMTLINSKEQKTSEFRQDWINGLRKEISELVSSVYFIKFYYQQDVKSKQKNSDPNFIKGLQDIHLIYAQTSTSILLRVNPEEKKEPLKSINEKFLAILTKVLQAVNNENYDDAAKNCNALIEESKPLLKEEWKRVKTGERSFRTSKWVAGGLFFIGIVFLIFFGFKIFTYQPNAEKDMAAPRTEPLCNSAPIINQNYSVTIPSNKAK